MTVPVTIRLQEADFDVAREIAALSRGRTDIGAVVTFSGICRSDQAGGDGGDAIAALMLEHYPGMAEEEIARHAEEALARWPLTGLTVIHRFGRIVPGENIVLVVTASSHREAAFHAAEFLMDYLKTRAPFWKREEGASGAGWVDAHDRDDTAAARWAKS
jgi:molybdopterin synthase catalytic subunit